jgi:hypothetical protein
VVIAQYGKAYDPRAGHNLVPVTFGIVPLGTVGDIIHLVYGGNDFQFSGAQPAPALVAMAEFELMALPA